MPTTATPPGGFVPPHPQELAESFPQLEVLELLGQGGMGAVYKARQKHLERLVALKILPAEVGQDPAFAERFAREARSLAKLNHPHIVTLYESGQTDDGLYYLIMEFVDGIDLRQVIRAGDLHADEAMALMPQICEALQYAHQQGVIHRDIKPENILLDTRGYVKIGDFGLAKLLDRTPGTYTLTQTQQRLGTPHYMAPEQVEGGLQIDHRADIYSLGVVFYELLTGELPLGRFPLPSQKVDVDVRLDEVVLRSLEKAPERRYQQASEVKTDVETISTSERVTPRRETSGDPGAAAEQRVRIPAIGLMISGAINFLYLALMVLVVLRAYRRQWDTPGEWFAGAVITVIPTMVGVILVMGAWKMLRLRSYGWAVASGVLALLPLSPGFMLSMPMGIWALYVLSRSDVQPAFAGPKRDKSRRPGRQPGTLFGIELQEHLKIVAYLRIGVGSVLLLVAVVVFSIMAIPGFASGEAEAMAILSAFGVAFALFPLGLAVPNLLGGVGLLKHRPRHRILVLIMGAIDLFGLPIGTLIGIYTIWVLVQKETIQLFTSTGDATE